MGQKTNGININKDFIEYQKVFWSANTRSLLLTALFVLAVACFALWISVELGIIVIVLFSPIFLYRTYDALIQPSRVTIGNEELIIDNIIINWDQVESVIFYRPVYSWLGIDGLAPFYYVFFPTYLAKINLSDNRIIKFSPRLYRPEDLRNKFEREACRHRINVKVRDL
ncbi:MAG: hypothetical protein CVU89_17505 [Firmicutes bacterium HGW-Firmicutes-14]|jgi:hypothetical protein|nr:MAG: hypothetical protein CVU89_17505 [Firmicutes bacterium HGW-Firmicutes-14]